MVRPPAVHASLCLQGSNDLQHWLDLRRHADDTTIRLPGMYGSWSVAGPAACMPFRAFRLLLTGPTQVSTPGWLTLRAICATSMYDVGVLALSSAA
jgi:hypothetical protein